MTAVLDIDEIRIDGHVQPIVLRCHRPSDQAHPLPLILYLHGGGFTGGGVKVADPVAAQLARRLPGWVVSVGYSLAPAFSFPVAHEDAFLALEWARKQVRRFGAADRRVAVVGHEAGGNIAAGLAAMARDRGRAVDAQVLIAPLLDPSMNHATTDPASIGGLTSQDIARRYRSYLPNGSQRVHPYAAPLSSCRLAGLPPTFIAVASADLLRTEGELYATQLARAGIETEVLTLRGEHPSELNERSPVLRGVNAFLKRHLSVD